MSYFTANSGQIQRAESQIYEMLEPHGLDKKMTFSGESYLIFSPYFGLFYNINICTTQKIDQEGVRKVLIHIDTEK